MQNLDHIESGWQLVDRNGDNIGDIEEIGANYFVVTKGLIFTKDVYVPLSAVTGTDRDERRVMVDVDKGQIDSMGWDQPPLGDVTGDDGGTAYDTSADAAYVSSSTTDASSGTTADYDTATTRDVNDTARVSLHEEQLRAQTVQEQAGEVQVRKDIVEEEQTLDVPVTREEVEVRRTAVDRPTDGAGISDTGDTIRVPVSAERVQVDKDVRVVEEIEISKRPVTETQRVSDTVRREEVNVDQGGDVMVDDGTRSGSLDRTGDR